MKATRLIEALQKLVEAMGDGEVELSIITMSQTNYFPENHQARLDSVSGGLDGYLLKGNATCQNQI